MSKWNLLPDDIINRIFQFKHGLDMKESLRTIERFKYKTFNGLNVYFNSTSSIKELLRYRISTRKIYICLKNYNCEEIEEKCYFRITPEYIETMAKKLDITIKPFYDCHIDTYPVAVLIKYNKPRLRNPVTLIEMIELLGLFKIDFVSFRDRNIVIENIYTTKYNYQITNINLDITCY